MLWRFFPLLITRNAPIQILLLVAIPSIFKNTYTLGNALIIQPIPLVKEYCFTRVTREITHMMSAGPFVSGLKCSESVFLGDYVNFHGKEGFSN